ncbi:MAG: N-acetyltransferase [Pseudomonadota bacterium]
MHIRAANAEDYAPIDALITAAFERDTEARLTEALRAAGAVRLELVAEEAGAIVGHILLSELEAPERSLGVGPVAAAPEKQQRGIGSALVERAVTEARAAGWRALFLLGDPAYYGRFGFSADAAARFDHAYPRKYMQALELTPGALASMTPQMRYAAPFRDLE